MAMIIIYTTGELYTEYKGACDFFRNGYYYTNNNQDGKPTEKVNCTVGYMLGSDGIPKETHIFIKEQYTDSGNFIPPETIEINNDFRSFDFKNEFDYVLLCENCISYDETQGYKVFKLCEIDTYYYEFAHCCTCDDNQDEINDTNEILYLCHY